MTPSLFESLFCGLCNTSIRSDANLTHGAQGTQHWLEKSLELQPGMPGIQPLDSHSSPWPRPSFATAWKTGAGTSSLPNSLDS